MDHPARVAVPATAPHPGAPAVSTGPAGPHRLPPWTGGAADGAVYAATAPTEGG